MRLTDSTHLSNWQNTYYIYISLWHLSPSEKIGITRQSCHGCPTSLSVGKNMERSIYT
jgi:hypothetical protein